MDEQVNEIFENAVSASSSVRNLADEHKSVVLQALADKLMRSAEPVLAANAVDLAAMDPKDPKRDRLLLNEQRIGELAASIRDVAGLSDPSNQVLYEAVNANGLTIQKITVPLGVVGVIYESRPNVTIDVASLCIRSGNACILRGGTDALHTNTALVALIRETLGEFGVDKGAVQLFPPAREHILDMLTAVRYVDIIIPRGSQQLIDYVRKNSVVPVIETGAGVCHTYVEHTAKIDDAAKIVVNAKVSRPSVCNALDTVLVDREAAPAFLPVVAEGLLPYHVEIFADDEAFDLLSAAGYPLLQRAGEEDFGREFLDFKCSVKIVGGPEEALEHIRKYSSRHSEAIVSENQEVIGRFLNEVDAAAVYANASTRFTDGGVFGLGAEIGISTQKLHARGPFALEKLVTEKWVVRGSGQIRV
jgi:glutamate-5-semialdehyde dehydrogenase